MTIDRFDCDTQADYEGGSFGMMRQESDGAYVNFDDHISAIKEERKVTAAKFADKFQSDFYNYVAAHKLEWSDSDEAVRDTLTTVIKELREGG